MKKFLVVDDHVVVRSGVKHLLSQLFSSSEIQEADNGDTVIEKLKSNEYDLIVMDVQMPKTDTLKLMEFIHINYPIAKVLIFSMSAENIYAKRFLKAGAKGFLAKDASLEEMKKAISLVMANRRYLSETFAESLSDSLDNNTENPFEKLSAREFEIITLLLAGHALSEIAPIINIRTSTIATYKARAFEKLKVSNLIDLKELAMSYDL